MTRGRTAGFIFKPAAFLGCLALLATVAVSTVAAAGGGRASALSRSAGLPASTTTAPSVSSPGYWLAASDGGVYQFGTTVFGSLRGIALDQPVVGGAATDDGLGYWLVARDGGIFSFGDAVFAGSTGGVRLNAPIVGMAADPVNRGYWMVASDGGVFSFGGAPFFGSTGGIRLDKPIVGMVPTLDGKGYWLVASDGGVFSFGDAGFFGSTGNVDLAKPIVGMAATANDRGYWLVAADGGIFTFGDAGFHGSTGGVALSAPVIGMAPTSDGRGYWLVGSDGGVFTFGDAPYLGAATGGPEPIVAILATAHGYPFLPGSTGNDIDFAQCSKIPTFHPSVRIVQMTGAINGYPNPCYQQEAAWAGDSISSYIFMNPVPSPAPNEALTGPAGTCNGSATCQGYNFGYFWAQHWANNSKSMGINPTLWWLDVEPGGGWSDVSSAQPVNASVIQGAVAGLKALGKLVGIYSTFLQWSEITGNQVNFPGMPLWVPGAGLLNTGLNNAVEMCTGTLNDYEPFAGGKIVLIQYGWTSSPYPYTYLEDYACT